MFGDAAIPYLEPYGGDYFSFVLIGIAFSSYLTTGLGSFSGSIRNEQMMGTLEAMLVTPTKTSLIIVFSSLWNFIFTSIRVLAYLSIGVFLLNVNMSNANLFGALITLILTIICHILPITYSLRAMRHALLQGYTLEALAPDIFALVIFSIVMLPLSIITFKYAVRRAKVDGSLTQY